MIRIVDAAEFCSPALEDGREPSGGWGRGPGEDCDFPVRGESENAGDDGAADEGRGAACYCYCGHWKGVFVHV